MTQGNRSRMLNEDLKGRLAEKIIEIENFPNGISMMPSVQKVNKWYIQSFRELTDVDVHKSEEYTKTLEGIYNRHSSTLMTFANGIIEYKKHLNDLFNNEIVNANNVIGYNDNFNILEYLEMNKRGERINNYLDMFYTNRISIRLLISHYLELEKGCDQVGYNGIVSLNEPLTYTIEEAVESSQQVCDRVYNNHPNINLKVFGPSPVFPFIKNNMFYIFFEVMKNSLRATMDKHGHLEDVPDVKVSIYNGDSTISIKVCDEGNGINYKNLENIWSYFYSTAKKRRMSINDQMELNDFDGSSPLAGYGYGLPITNLLVGYFGDKIQINSIKGVGTDVCLHFHKNVI
jgi:pyruvate dehydrogenase kinase 2/3/4